jgi:hypothetical protein
MRLTMHQVPGLHQSGGNITLLVLVNACGIPTLQYQNRSDFFGRKKRYLKTPSTEHLAEDLLGLMSKVGLIDWYLCTGGTVPIPGCEHQSILLGTFHSQGGRDGFIF